MKDVLYIGELFTISDVNEIIDEFMSVYAKRPIIDNHGGMMSTHIFWTWYALRKICPRVVIESGVFKGQGTWIIRKACPEAEIISIDPDLSQREYIDSQSTYFSEDFGLINWDDVLKGTDFKDALCFFDDHQNAYRRIQEMYWMGFKKAIFEDNYPIKRGDCYSIKKVLSESGFISSDSNLVIPPNNTHSSYLKKHVKTYYTFPPLVKDKYTRWGDEWDDDFYLTESPVLSKQNESKYPLLVKDAKTYNWMCYVELK